MRALVLAFYKLTNLSGQVDELLLFDDGFSVVPWEGDLGLHVYSDCRPHNLETAELQKGLVLVLNGKELIEEGVGFGVPVVIYSDETYFSGSAHVLISEDVQDKIIIKHFYMDRVSRKSWIGRILIDNRIYRMFTNFLADVYRNRPTYRKVIFPLIRLRSKIGIKTIFVKVESRGEIIVEYRIRERSINVEVDFTKLSKGGCRCALLLNEQGSTFFKRFVDSDGLNLSNDQIGAWDLIKADWACLSNSDGTLGFCLKSIPNCKLFRGRERIEGRMAWAGIGYELSQVQTRFNYRINLRGSKDD